MNPSLEALLASVRRAIPEGERQQAALVIARDAHELYHRQVGGEDVARELAHVAAQASALAAEDARELQLLWLQWAMAAASAVARGVFVGLLGLPAPPPVPYTYRGRRGGSPADRETD